MSPRSERPAAVPTHTEREHPWVGMIWAQARDRVIGDDGDMPWHLPEDFAHFRAMTRGCPVVMGRRTWESLPEAVRPLPGRRNIVVTGDASRAAEIEGAGAEAVDSLATGLQVAAAPTSTGASSSSDGSHDSHGPPERIWILGGGAIYAEAVEHGLADAAVVTVIDLAVDGDTRAPRLPEEDWRLESADPPDGDWHIAENGLRHRFETHVRR
ncbi:dihydrofolate reductase [Nesterenkonia sp. F]|uniref:dihydrofolate reductase n=1 Tax=Nesterenkonia sp. F TaxID=795955 RepID=UPI00031A307C|nr:dihydrofolate reductase [Nesterenkonia sp. F]